MQYDNHIIKHLIDLDIDTSNIIARLHMKSTDQPAYVICNMVFYEDYSIRFYDYISYNRLEPWENLKNRIEHIVSLIHKNSAVYSTVFKILDSYNLKIIGFMDRLPSGELRIEKL